ncbi:hypothetical protein LRP67_08210 [Nocardioides sp. cx-169]|uniref:hypothetical protein n=1 Tax=Nocardioides sp. cx-169 TaxID=2899080 RepID=UPI001E376CEB|nr:hypothetical protein [Nocardioides sp. cx-169]MCD4534059.1 hypothetical protein [Nocardioides sp. cx-169]
MTQPQTVARPALVIAGFVLLGLTCGIGGWFIGAEGEPTSVEHAPFEARVESVNEGGLRGCLAPVEPTVLENLGGSVCGQIFIAAGTDTSRGARVLVRWFTTNAPVGGREDENVETFVLESSGRMR